MIGIVLLIAAAKMYARGIKVSDEDAKSVLLARAESLDAMGNKTLSVVAKLSGLLWCFYGSLLCLEACGYPHLLDAMGPWLWTTAVVLLIA